jgi:hypothetical protein
VSVGIGRVGLAVERWRVAGRRLGAWLAAGGFGG